MGFTPEQVGRMSLYQFAACVDGVNKANTPNDKGDAPTDEEFRAAKEAHGDL
jgi:hypothetical protein